MSEEWIDNPKLAHMDKEKLLLLQQLADQGNGKSPSELLPFLLGILRSDQKNKLGFQEPDISVILEVLKAGKSPRERAKLDRIISMLKNIR